MQRVPDHEFEFHILTTGPVHHVLRQCILWSLVNFKPGRDPNWKKGFALLRRLWRAQIRALQILEWKPARTHPWRLRNCCPTMCYVTPPPPKIETCNMDTICPDCYARAHERLVDRLLQLERLESNDDTLLFFRGVEYVAYDLLDTAGVRTKLQDLSRVLQGLLDTNGQGWSGKTFRPSRYSGAYWVVAVDPQESSDQEVPECHWRFESRLLVSLPKGGTLLSIPKEWKRREFPLPSIFDYNSALVSALRYPRGLLRGPATAVLRLLEARKGLKLSGVRGTFRSEGGQGGDSGGS